jgi:SecD/SecF fusion protein
MSEVLTRSLATSFTTLLAVLSLLIFGSSTLQDFAFAMMIGIASGTYSSIFIASPVLTAWKEREPQYVRRRQRIAEVEGGMVPAFADDVQVARLASDDETEEEIAPEELERAAASGRKGRSGAVATAEIAENGSSTDGVVAPEPSGAPEASTAPGAEEEPSAGAPGGGDPESAERRKRNEERRAKRAQRRKGGRRR